MLDRRHRVERVYKLAQLTPPTVLQRCTPRPNHGIHPTSATRPRCSRQSPTSRDLQFGRGHPPSCAIALPNLNHLDRRCSSAADGPAARRIASTALEPARDALAVGCSARRHVAAPRTR